MAILLPSLLKLANIDYVTEEEKYKLVNLAWETIARQYFLRLSLERRKILDEVKKGKRTYNPNDFTELEARLTHEFAQKLESAENQNSLEEVKQNLEKYKSQPLTQDKASTS